MNTNINTNLESTVLDVSCSLGRGSNMSIAATVLYFVCMCLIPSATVIPPVSYPGEAAADADEGRAAEVDASEEA